MIVSPETFEYDRTHYGSLVFCGSHEDYGEGCHLCGTPESFCHVKVAPKVRRHGCHFPDMLSICQGCRRELATMQSLDRLVNRE